MVGLAVSVLLVTAGLACFLYAYAGAFSQNLSDSWLTVLFLAAVYLLLSAALSLSLPLP